MENGGSVEWRIEANSAQFHEGLSAAQQAAYDFYRALEEIDKATGDAEKSLDSVGKKGNEVAQIMSNLGASIGRIATGAATAGIATLTASFTKMAKQGIADTSALEDIQIQMQGLTHSSSKAAAAMGMAVEYFRNNPFNRFDVTNATKSLIQFGAELEDVPDLLDKLGKVSLSTGAKIDEVAYYYQRNISDGRVATLDLLQMQNRGIPIFAALAKQMGVTAGEVRNLAGEGKIAVEDFQKAFDNLVDSDAMEAYNKTLSRQMDAFKGRLSNLRAAIAGYDATEAEGLVITEGGLYQSWVSMLKVFNDTMKTTSPTAIKINESLTKLGQTVGTLINKFAEKLPNILDKIGDALSWLADNSELLLPILSGVVLFVGKAASKLPVIGGVINSLGSSLGGLTGNIGKLAKLNPALTVFVGLFSVGIFEAFKNNENFRKSVSKLVSSLATIITKCLPAINALVNAFVDLASNGAVQALLEGVVWVLGELANILANMPTEVFAAIIGFFVGSALMKASPIYVAVAALSALYSVVKQFIGKDPLTAIAEAWTKFVKTVSALGTEFYRAAQDMIAGLINGIKDGANSVIAFTKNLGTTIIGTFKQVLGIHSPSKVMMELGGNITLGLAQGITDKESVVQNAMDALADDVLSLADKVINSKLSFGSIDVNGAYKDWKKVTKLFTVGSKQYESAVAKMEDARKSINLEIISLQKDYNDTLDDTIDRLKSMYSLFDTVDLSKTANSGDILGNLDKQVAKLGEWQAAQDVISGLNLSDGLKEELRNMGVESVAELSAIAGMTTSELEKLDKLWLSKQSIATEEAGKQLEGYKNETLETISKLKDGVDGETVNVYEAGGRLVSSLSEGIVGALPTLDSAWAKIDEYIAKAARSLGGGTSAGGGDNNPEDEPGETVNVVEKALSDITAAVENNAGVITAVLAGLAGGAVWKWFTGKSVGQSLLGGLKDLFGKGGAELGQAARTSGDIAKNTEVLNNNLGSAGKSMGGIDKWFKVILEGAAAVVAISVALAAVAGAIWVMDTALADVKWDEFGSKLGMVAVAVVGMGVLVGAIGTLIEKTGSQGAAVAGVLAVVGIAIDLAAVGAALGVVEKSMSSDIGGLAAKLGIMAVAIIGMGVIVAAIGAIMVGTGGLGALAAAGGILAVVGLAWDIAETAKALGEVERQLPDDLTAFSEKIKMVEKTIAIMGVLAGAIGVFAPFEAAGSLIIIALAEDLVKIATSITVADAVIPNDIDRVNSKLDLLEITIGRMGILGGAIGVFAPIEKAGAKAIKDLGAAVKDIAIDLGVMALAIPDDLGKVITKFGIVESVVERISKTNMGNFLKNLTKSWSVDKIKNIIDDYGEIAIALNTVHTNLMGVDNITGKIDDIHGVLGQIESMPAVSDLKNKEWVVGMVASICFKMGEVVTALGTLGVVDEAGVVSIVGAMNSIVDGVSKLGEVDFKKIESLGVNMVASLKGGIESVKGTVRTVAEGIQSEFWSGLESKKKDEYAQGQALARELANGLNSVVKEFQAAGHNAQSNFWTGVQERMGDEYNQGRSLGERFRQGLYDIDYANAGWWAVQGFINGVNNRGYYSNDNVYSVGANIADTFLKGIKDRGLQGSPWKTTMESGAWAVEGLVKGLEKNENKVVNEANIIAESVLEAFDFSDVTISPSVDDFKLNSGLDIEGASIRGGSGVIINQTNNNYSEYSVEAVNRDLAWMLSKV